MGWMWIGGALAAWFTRWQRGNRRSGPEESIPKLPRWRGGFGQRGRNMAKSLPKMWKTCVPRWVCVNFKNSVMGWILIKKNTLKVRLSFPGTVAVVQEPQREAGLLGRERSTVTPVLQGNQLQDAGGGACRASIHTRCEYTNYFKCWKKFSAHVYFSAVINVYDWLHVVSQISRCVY